MVQHCPWHRLQAEHYLKNEHYEHAIHCDKAHGDVRNASFSDYKINVKITSSEAGKLSENVYNR